MVGSVASLPAVWAFADIANGLMAVPNLVSLVAMSGVIVAETRTHLWHASTAGSERPVLRARGSGRSA
jgi:AGCS family alanine or glycine:cation symporter